ncbi:hypothetical protein J2X69_003280 [Algoriphagus sp. 4150]|uniref:DUF6428 family protein n=1 Tax=Algoriphagus sp. 4150 TaxID=2817756 RepID=UPI0028574455|nr:DUF6428 family protein [Algoriphagus sp. 4150]MDR7130921.1 hypothetical protein [Algoriphagus sp. 4150]
MNVSEVKTALGKLDHIAFQLPDGSLVPTHFHVTEVGKISKHFIDCGGTVRTENVANFQLWNADDYNHRLNPEKLHSIIELSEKVLGLEDLEVEVEYQADTIGKFGLEFDGKNFLLTSKQTDCLAKDKCGVPQEKEKLSMAVLAAGANACAPGSGCC